MRFNQKILPIVTTCVFCYLNSNAAANAEGGKYYDCQRAVAGGSGREKTFEAIGNYAVPVLPSWTVTVKRRKPRQFTRLRNGKPKVYNVPEIDEARFRRKVEGVELEISFTAIGSPREITRADVQQSLQAAVAILKMVDVAPKNDPRFVEDKPYAPGQTPWFTRRYTMKDIKGLNVLSHELHFGDARAFYSLDLTLRGSKITPKARNIGEQGWTTITNQLKKGKIQTACVHGGAPRHSVATTAATITATNRICAEPLTRKTSRAFMFVRFDDYTEHTI